MRKLAAASPNSSGCERNRANEPMGLARRQAKPLRWSGASDSGSTKKPYAALARLKAAATQNGSRGSSAPNTPPSAGPRMKPDAERSAEQAVAGGAALGRRHVGDIGIGRRDAGA